MNDKAIDVPIKVPEKVVIDTSNIKFPLEIKVDQVTDYGALTFTLFITALVSAISAYVTVILVTKSNNKLIESQKEQNEKQLLKQEEFLNRQIVSQELQKNKELNAHTRQLWNDNIRELATQFLFNINLLPLQIMTTVNTYNHAVSDSKFHEKSLNEFAKTDEIMRKIEIHKINLELFLNKDIPLDLEIILLLKKLLILAKDINANTYEEFTDKINFKSITFKEFYTLPEMEKFYDAEIRIKDCFSKLVNEKRSFEEN